MKTTLDKTRSQKVVAFLRARRSTRYPADELGKHLARLLHAHPAAKERFGTVDLHTSDDATKTAMLREINQMLGIKTLRGPG